MLKQKSMDKNGEENEAVWKWQSLDSNKYFYVRLNEKTLFCVEFSRYFVFYGSWHGISDQPGV